MKRILIGFACLLLSLSLVGCGFEQAVKNNLSGQTESDATIEPLSAIDATIKRVVDGDTMKVLINGKEDTVRLLLVDTPETKKPGAAVQPFGPEASAFAEEVLPDGTKVELEIGQSERDKYNRLLAYLWVDGEMFNEQLLEKGLARVAYVYETNTKYEDQYRKTETEAENAGIGIWSIKGYVTDRGFNAE